MTKVFLISTMSVIVLLGGTSDSNGTEKESTPNLHKQTETAKNGNATTTANNNGIIHKKGMENNISVVDKNVSVRESENSSDVQKELKKETQLNKVKVKELYARKCASCHGADGKTKAMGKSATIAGGSDIESKLKEYRLGKRDVTGMGGVMKSQASSLSDEEIKILSEYITGLR